jgi:hypothetical protein
MEDLNAALNRSLIGDALARLSPQHRAVVRRSYYHASQAITRSSGLAFSASSCIF